VPIKTSQGTHFSDKQRTIRHIFGAHPSPSPLHIGAIFCISIFSPRASAFSYSIPSAFCLFNQRFASCLPHQPFALLILARAHSPSLLRNHRKHRHIRFAIHLHFIAILSLFLLSFPATYSAHLCPIFSLIPWLIFGIDIAASWHIIIIIGWLRFCSDLQPVFSHHLPHIGTSKQPPTSPYWRPFIATSRDHIGYIKSAPKVLHSLGIRRSIGLHIKCPTCITICAI
jgi:hypothetical protein